MEFCIFNETSIIFFPPETLWTFIFRGVEITSIFKLKFFWTMPVFQRDDAGLLPSAYFSTD